MKEEIRNNEEIHIKKRKKKARKKGRVSVSTIILVAIMMAGVMILLYPSVSDWWNSMHATRAISEYVDKVDSMSKEEKEEIFEKAREYNESLPNGVHFELTEEEYAEYERILDITGTGIMGYVQIKSIGVNLPVYHGVDEGILQIAVGHIAGSSFPIGGRTNPFRYVRPPRTAQCKTVLRSGQDEGRRYVYGYRIRRDGDLYG